ncbi:putative benzoate 4-monooxygenase cytochrome p450 protein [Golovinomyces cichoracearum]|uniref:Putative benzoate 4-monooxygenase cytochrome p450 protein n=1 Tax=Golovinomyces cichoracearum TaxID=62708 RepID=A0A420IHX1_9PEZI|nr:putative benzoate 4-monooxygenase cytochrome p450 protein [Golovinomyces cichoracearum]
MDPIEGPGEEKLNLENLYLKLQDLELLEEQIMVGVDTVFGRAFFNGLEVYTDGSNGQKIRHKSFSDSPFFEEVRDKAIFFKNAVQKINQFRDILRMHINICSRPFLRPLHILELPDEILVQICEYVQGREEYFVKHLPEINIGVDEVKNMRLTCRRFCNASSHLLISCMNLEFDSDSLSYLKDISSHPTISKGVRVIRLNLLYYDYVLEEDIDTFGDYHARRLLETTECIQDMANYGTDLFTGTPKDVVKSSILKGFSIGNAWLYLGGETTNIVSEEDLGYQKLLLKAYRKYRKLYARQKHLQLTGNYPRAISAAMSKMSNATRLDIFNSDFVTRPKRHQRPDFITMVNNEESLINSTLFPITWEKGRRFGLGEPPLELLIQLPIAIKKAGIFLTSLDIRVPPNDFFFLASDEESLESIKMSTQRLRKFSYDPRVPHFSDLWAVEEQSEVNALGKYLSAHLSSPVLMDIQLTCDFLRADNFSPWFSLGSVLTQYQWPKLESLSLTGLAFQFSELEQFISQFDLPIVLWLRRVHLLSGTWARALDLLRGKVRAYPILEELSGGEFDDMSDQERKRILGKNDNSWDMNKAELYILSSFSTPNPFRSDEIESPSQEY